MIVKNSLFPLMEYVGPWWVSKLKNLPKFYVKLARKETLIENWTFSHVPNGFRLHIKRDDLTGNMLSGNKVRKLEFLLADALLKESTAVITCGGLQSNHCRATAVAAKMLKIDCHLLHRSRNQKGDVDICSGNMLLNRIYGAHSYTVPYESLSNGLNTRLEKLALHLKAKGQSPYIVPLGGSNKLGAFGIIDLFAELFEQDVISNFDDIVVATGSGGTLAGLAVANYLTGEKLRIHGVCVSDHADYFLQHIDDMLVEYGLNRARAHQICDVIEGYKGEGYGMTNEEDLNLLIDICQQTGVLLDYTYTLKGVKGMLAEMRVNPARFKGKRVLYIHTGGMFSAFDGTMNETLKKRSTLQPWSNIAF